MTLIISYIQAITKHFVEKNLSVQNQDFEISSEISDLESKSRENIDFRKFQLNSQRESKIMKDDPYNISYSGHN